MLEKLLKLLKSHFGFDRFLPLQEEIIQRVAGGRDALVLMPTGGGKSLCYQLPALCFRGLTLVVSPLIALMKDQVDALNANGIAASFCEQHSVRVRNRQGAGAGRVGQSEAPLCGAGTPGPSRVPEISTQH